MDKKSIFGKQYLAEHNKIIAKYYIHTGLCAKIDYLHYSLLLWYYNYKVSKYFKNGRKVNRNKTDL